VRSGIRQKAAMRGFLFWRPGGLLARGRARGNRVEAARVLALSAHWKAGRFDSK